MSENVKSISIKLVCTPGCQGSSKADELIREIIGELKGKVSIEYSKEIVISMDQLSEKEIYGSPTVLVNGKDVEYGDKDELPKSLG